MKKKDKKISVKELLHLYYRSCKIIGKYCPGLMASCFLYTGVSAVTPYATVYLSAQIINELAGKRDPEQLWKLVIITLAVTSGLAMINAILFRWKEWKRQSYWWKVKRIYSDKFLDMDFCSVDDQHTYDLYSQILQNSQWGGRGIHLVVPHCETLVGAVMRILGAIALTVSLFTKQIPAEKGTLCVLNHPLCMLGIVAVLLAVTILAPICSSKAESCLVSCMEHMKFSNRLESFYVLEMVEQDRASDMRMYEQQKVCEKYADVEPLWGKNSLMAKMNRGPIGFFNALSSGISAVFTGLVYVFVCLKAWGGAFGVGSVTQYIGAITALSRGVSDLFATLGSMKNNESFLKTAFEFLDIPNDMYQGSLTTEKRSDRKYEIEFRNVSFKYPGTETYALRNLSVKFKIGERLAVVGMNGSGKTTFIKLLCRLYDPDEGEILLNGINIRKYNYQDYMQLFSVVFQDFQLLAFSLGQNVAASMNYDRKRAEECLRKAGFGERLDAMPKGVDTCLYREFDQEGVNVSGGEGQKIALARVLYKDAPFIILDEPTAALDPIAEAEVYSKFDEIVEDKTTVYISHRLSSCRFCDEIIVFDEGKVVQQGTHERLVAEKGKYQELWLAQAQYYSEKEQENMA